MIAAVEEAATDAAPRRRKRKGPTAAKLFRFDRSFGTRFVWLQ